MKNKIAVYTCITGDYDNLKEIEDLEEGIDYYCFTNNENIISNTWNVIHIKDETLTNIELARKIKILGHDKINNYDVLLWMDGAIIFNKKIKDFINYYLKEKDIFVAFKHGERDNIYDEAFACVKVKKETKKKIENIFRFYQKENYNYDNGLIESTVYIKRPKEKIVQDTMKLWFDMVKNYSHRDQLSFNYCIYKTGMKVKWINEKVFDNEWFKWKAHNTIHNNMYKVYFDYGEGFSEEESVTKKYKISNKKYKVDVKIPKGTRNLRFEPASRDFMYCKNIHIHNISKDRCHYNNIFVNNKYLYFINDNPNILINLNKTITNLEIDFELYEANDAIVKSVINNLYKESLEKDKSIGELSEQNNLLSYKLDRIINSKSYKIARFIYRLLKRICLRGEKK